jgi:hypothetical protein
VNCEALVEGQTPIAFVITLDTCEAAALMLEHFNKTKLFLANYIINPLESFEIIANKIFLEHRNKPTIGGDFVNMEPKIVHLMQKILRADFTVVVPQIITKGNGRVDDVIEAMKILEKYSLGKTQMSKALNSHLLTQFTKISSVSILAQPCLGEHISNLALDLNEFIDHIVKTELFELTCAGRDGPTKRPYDTHDSLSKSIPAAKKRKIDQRLRVPTFQVPIDTSIQSLEVSVPMDTTIQSSVVSSTTPSNFLMTASKVKKPLLDLVDETFNVSNNSPRTPPLPEVVEQAISNNTDNNVSSSSDSSNSESDSEIDENILEQNVEKIVSNCISSQKSLIVPTFDEISNSISNSNLIHMPHASFDVSQLFVNQKCVAAMTIDLTSSPSPTNNRSFDTRQALTTFVKLEPLEPQILPETIPISTGVPNLESCSSQ